MKRILLAIGSSEIGGAQGLFSIYVEGLKERGYDVAVILPEGPLVDEVKKMQVKLFVVNIKSLSGIWKISKILKNNKFDIINAHLTYCSLLFSFISLFYKIPICCSLHNAIVHEKLNWIQKKTYPAIASIMARISRGIIVNSEWTKKHMCERLGVKEEKVKVIYSGLKEEKFQRHECIARGDKFRIGVVGRLSREKGQKYLIKALNFIDIPNYECLVVGDGPMRGNLESMVSECGLQDKVTFAGFRDDVENVMSEFDVVVLPSVNESLPITVIESFFLKKLVIASNVGGVPELVKDGITGLLVDPRDPEHLSDKIGYAYENFNETKKMTENAYRFAEKELTSSKMVDATVECYRSIIN